MAQTSTKCSTEVIQRVQIGLFYYLKTTRVLFLSLQMVNVDQVKDLHSLNLIIEIKVNLVFKYSKKSILVTSILVTFC